MKYIVYQTINKINNKFYIGVHKTDNPDIFDGYLGCGAYNNKPTSYNKTKYPLHLALVKYGVNNFYREILKIFDTEEEALKLESELVTEEFIKRTDTYNVTLGGGMPPKLTKVVYEFDLKGNLIKQWDSIVEASKFHQINKDRIHMCISDKRSIRDTYWSESPIINISEYRLSPMGTVYQYNEFGELLHIFQNATEASQKLDIDRQAIINATFHRTKLHGCYYLHADEDILKLLEDKKNKINAAIRSVYRYSKNGDYECEYKSIKEAEKDTGADHSNICRAIKRDGLSGGYKWSYIKSKKHTPYKQAPQIAIKVAQYDLQHNLIKIWDSVTECKKEFPSCQKVCKKETKSTKGFIFEYVKDIV